MTRLISLALALTIGACDPVGGVGYSDHEHELDSLDKVVTGGCACKDATCARGARHDVDAWSQLHDVARYSRDHLVRHALLIRRFDACVEKLDLP